MENIFLKVSPLSEYQRFFLSDNACIIKLETEE